MANVKSCEELHEILTEIVDVCCTLIDAVISMAAELDVDVEDFVKKMDDALQSKLRECAVEQRMVRPSLIPKTAVLDMSSILLIY